jgi:hypothetical protein
VTSDESSVFNHETPRGWANAAKRADEQRFQQQETLRGAALISVCGCASRGSLRADGHAGPARIHAPDAMPAIVPTRLAIRRVFAR